MKKATRTLLVSLLAIISLITSTFASIDPSLKINDTKNVAPTVNFSVALKKDIDLIIITDYSGADITNINSQINSLKIALSGRYNVKPHFIGVDTATKAPKNILLGKQNNNVSVYTYNRNFRIDYTKTGYEDRTGYPRTNWNNTPDVMLVAYESVKLNEGQTLPPFQKSNNYTFIKTKTGQPYQGIGFGYIYDQYNLYDPQNIAATKVIPEITTNMTMSGYYMYMTYNITSKTLENKWTLSNVSSQSQVNDYQAVNMGDINSLSLKLDSEKFVIFLSKGENTQSYRGWGSYYCFGSIKNSNIGNFVTANNPSIYTIIPTQALDIKLNQTSDRLDRVPGQELSINELINKTTGEKQYYAIDQFNAAMEHIKARYTESTSRSIDIKVATDYTDTKLDSLKSDLNTLKNSLSSYGIAVNYDIFNSKSIGYTNSVTNKKIAGSGAHRALLRGDGALYYYKLPLPSGYRSTIVPPSLIYEQYPYAQTHLPVQTYQTWTYDTWGGRYAVYKPYSPGFSFEGVPIPPVKVADNVSDCAIINNLLFYLKNGTLYVVGNIQGGSIEDNFVHQPLINGDNISKIESSSDTIFAIKNDGSLWVISSQELMYAHGRDTYDNFPNEVKQGIRSFNLYRVGNTNLANVRFKDVAIGGNSFAIGLTVDGEVYSWGNNDYGQFGNGQSNSFSGNYTPLVYRYPTKSNLKNITSIGTNNNAGVYYITSNGIPYFSGLAGVTYEPYDTYSMPTTNTEPVPYYFKISNLSKRKSLSTWSPSQGQTNYYYRVENYTPYITLLYRDGLSEVASGMSDIKNITAGRQALIQSSGTMNIDINTFRTVIDNNYNYAVNYQWNTLTAAERSKKIADYNTSYDVLFNNSNISYVMDNSIGYLDPIIYSVIDSSGTLRDNTLFSTEAYNNNGNYTDCNSKLVSYYNIDSNAVFEKINTAVSIDVEGLDLSAIAASALQSQSDRYFIYASDTYGSPDSNAAAYFSLLKLPGGFADYLSSNAFQTYIVSPTANLQEANIKALVENKNGINPSAAGVLNNIVKHYNPSAFTPAAYLVIDEDEVVYKDSYADYEHDSVKQEQYMYEHDPSVFENSTGTISNAEQWTNTPINIFNKKGKYIIHYKAQDSASASDIFASYRKWSNESLYTVYVHERPVALANVSITPNGSFFNIKASDGGSYDNDHLSREDKGIVAHEWRWKESAEAVWHNEQINITNAVMSKVYYIEHRVKDLEDAWSNWDNVTVDNTKPPTAQYVIAKKPITTQETLKLKDTSTAGFGTIVRWQWIILKLDSDTIIFNNQYNNSNNGSGAMAGYDVNVKTTYTDVGPGTYRIYLRVKGSNGLWSDGGTDALNGYNLSNCYHQDLVVQEAFKLEKFRVVKVRDLQLEGYYYNSTTGRYDDKPMYVNNMAIDPLSFGSIISGLTKGYLFEFEIDSVNFNESLDTIVIEPHFYTGDIFTRDTSERDLYWEDSKHSIWKAGQGAHTAWGKITLTSADRTIIDANKAAWRGGYLIPGSSWAVPKGTLAANAKGVALKRDIIVNFSIKGYKNGVEKFDYNATQWPTERTITKSPYQIGDVIRYSWYRNCLDDIESKDNR